MEIQIAKTKYFRVQVEDGVCARVCARTRVANTTLSTWLWNDKNVCVWATSMILPVLKVACVCVCVFLRPLYAMPLPLAVNFAS